MRIEPIFQSVGRRRMLRRHVRAQLGTTHDEAPGPLSALAAADSLKALVELSTGGRFGLAAWDFQTQSAIPIGDAIETVRASRAVATEEDR